MNSVRAGAILVSALTALTLAIGYGQAALDQAEVIGDYDIQSIVTGQEEAPALPTFNAPFDVGN